MILSVGLLLLAFLGECYCRDPIDCADLNDRGKILNDVYRIYPNGSAVNVYCDMGCPNSKDSTGWTVFQRRMDGMVNFYRSWSQYKNGFGNVSGEYWLGLDVLQLLTSKKTYELQVDMEDFEGNKVFARYSSFSVGSEAEGYKLSVSGFTDGGAGDSLLYHNGANFSTFDKDQDTSTDNCASLYLGAYWYVTCHYSNPNGVYLWGSTTHYATGVVWRTFKEYYYSLKSITMKIRPRP